MSAINTLTPRVSGVYFLKSGQQRDVFGLQDLHPNSNINKLEIYLEDGDGKNTVFINFRNDKKSAITSHWFPTIFMGYVNHTLIGEEIPRTFAKYVLFVSTMVTKWNLNGHAPLPISSTVVQVGGDRLIGLFGTLNDLNNEYNQSQKENLYLNNKVAYVYGEDGEYGFYKLELDQSNYVWTKIDNPLDAYNIVDTKQYNILGLTIQKGNAPTVKSQITISDEYIRFMLSTLAEIKDSVIFVENELGDKDGGAVGNTVWGEINYLLFWVNKIMTDSSNISYDNQYSGLTATNIQDAIDELENIMFKKDGSVKATGDFDLNNKGIYDVSQISVGEINAQTQGGFIDVNDEMRFYDKTIGREGASDYEFVVKKQLDLTKTEINSMLDDKVDKTQKIIGIDLQDDILLTEFKTALGNATQSVAGLLSAEDKTHIDGLVALLETSDGNNVVDTIGEILAIFQNYPEGADLVTALNGKVDKEAGKGLSQNDFTDIDKNKVDLSYTHSEIVDGSNPHNTKFVNIDDKPTTRDGYGITDVYTKPETYTQLEINNLLDNLSAVKGLKSTLLTPIELSNGDTISTNLLTNNGAFVVFTATDTSTGEIDSDTVPVSTIITGKRFVFFDNQEIVFTIGETNSTFETSEDVTLKINLLYLDDENTQAISVDFDGSSTNYLENQENVQSAINKLDEELKTTNDNKVDKVEGKGLSTNDYTTAEKNKLSGIEAGAEVNVQSDWTQEVNTADDYIKNKPAIPTKTSDLTNDSGFITTETDPIFTAWDKSTGISITKSQITDLIEATQTISGLMSATDKQRLDVLHALLEEDEANTVVDSINEVLAIFNNYPEGADLVSALAGKVDKNNAITAGTKAKITYDAKGLVTSGSDLASSDIPNLDAGKITTGTFGVDRIPALAPSKITQDANHLFVTDNEKSTWNGKVTSNSAITGATKTKITYDSKGLVTGGDDLVEADIPALPASKITQTTTARFVTDTEKSTWNNKQNALTAGDGISISGNVISADSGITVETFSSTATKTLAISDANKLFICYYPGNQTVTIPTNADVAFPIGTMITFYLTTIYKVTFVGADGVTLTSMDSLVELATLYSMASLIKTNANTWQLVGALE